MSIVLEKERTNNFYKTAIPIIFSVFIVFLTLGMALGVLPEFVRANLRQSNLMVGIVISLQSVATLLTRAYAGKIADTKGAKTGFLSGLILIMVTGASYCLAATLCRHTTLALVILLLGRIIHGIAESLLLTGALSWGISLVGTGRSGKMMSWNGIAMYGGIALGAPLSIWMTKICGVNVNYVFALIILFPIISWLSTLKLPILEVDKTHIRIPFYKVINLIFRQGAGLALSAVGYGCIISFIALFFIDRNWGNASLAFSTFGICYVLPRIFFASLPDKYGGLKVSAISLIVQTIGLIIIGFTSSKIMAIVGCGITAVGSSLVFPALGVLALNKVKPQMKGTALVSYGAFTDVALGLTGPLAGLLVGWFNFQSVYFFAGICSLLAIGIIMYKKK